MDISAFIQRHDETKKYDCLYYLHPELWMENIHITSILHNKENWSDYIKYLNDRNLVSDEIKNLPKDFGGIYIFFIQGISLPFCERYLAYIGRAQCTKSESLRSRVTSYLRESKKEDGRTRINRLFKYWKEHLYIRYYKSTDNEFIKQSESALIQAILPPFNTELTKYKIKKSRKAF
jgi:hypothetical protein